MDDGKCEIRGSIDMSGTGGSDHRAVDGADRAQLTAAFKALVGNPLRLVA